jgi:hypothetical protein
MTSWTGGLRIRNGEEIQCDGSFQHRDSSREQELGLSLRLWLVQANRVRVLYAGARVNKRTTEAHHY